MRPFLASVLESRPRNAGTAAGRARIPTIAPTDRASGRSSEPSVGRHWRRLGHVGPQHATTSVDEAREPRRRRPATGKRIDSTREQHFRLVDVTDSGGDPLIEQGIGNRTSGFAAAAIAAPASNDRRARRDRASELAVPVQRRRRDISATGMLKPIASKSAVAMTIRMSRRQAAATARPDGRCASCRSCACGCAARIRWRSASGGVCPPRDPLDRAGRDGRVVVDPLHRRIHRFEAVIGLPASARCSVAPRGISCRPQARSKARRRGRPRAA